MTKILFVDDERMVLNGLRRMLHKYQDRWDVSFEDSGQHALEAMESTAFDVIVSDMRMPGMNGNQLLAEVQKRHPGTVRVILSGHADKQLILESTRLAHQYLSKPCEEGELESTIERCCQLRSLLQDESLVQLVSKLTTIPSLPELYTEIVELVEGNAWTIQDVGQIISKDVGMTAKVLQLVNSSFFGLRRHVGTTDDAVGYLGVDTIQALVLSVHLFTQFTGDVIGDLNVQELTTHNLRTGLLARAVANAESAPRDLVDQAFLAGSLHDAGRLVLAANAPEKYAQVLALMEHEGLGVCSAELRVFGSTHAQVVAYLLSLWGLPNTIVEAAAYHHTPADLPGDKFSPTTAVHVANALEKTMDNSGMSDAEDSVAAQIDMNYLKRLDLVDRLPIWIAACREPLEGGRAA